MNILQASKQTNISKSAIRFYEEKGLLQPERKDNGYRDYTEEHIQEIRWISVLRKADFSIEAIKMITDLKQREQSEICKEDTLQFIEGQITKIAETIEFLSRINGALDDIHKKIKLGEVQSTHELLAIIAQVEVVE